MGVGENGAGRFSGNEPMCGSSNVTAHVDESSSAPSVLMFPSGGPETGRRKCNG